MSGAITPLPYNFRLKILLFVTKKRKKKNMFVVKIEGLISLGQGGGGRGGASTLSYYHCVNIKHVHLTKQKRKQKPHSKK